MLHNNLKIGENGHLYFGGVDTVEMAKKYGTPLYLIHEDRIRENCRRYKDALQAHFGNTATPLYASKALCYSDLYRILKEEGLGIDIVSGGELYTALRSGFDTSEVFFHGNNKTEAEIIYALKSKVGYIVADNLEELDVISRVAGTLGIVQNVLLRLSPGVDSNTHKSVATGSVDSKFGFSIKTGQAETAGEYALTLPNVNLVGFHCHIGSQILQTEPFVHTTRIMLNFVSSFIAKTKADISILNLGGGVGAKYTKEQNLIDYNDFFAALKNEIDSFYKQNEPLKLKYYFEMGRSIVADAGITLYTVGSFKNIKGHKNYISVDGGMTDNIRYALYKAPYTILVANKVGEPKDTVSTIVGRACESGDILQEDVTIQSCKRGDVLAVLVTGAYNFTMASNYNRLPKPPIVNLRGGVDEVVVRRETYEDLTKNEIILDQRDA